MELWLTLTISGQGWAARRASSLLLCPSPAGRPTLQESSATCCCGSPTCARPQFRSALSCRCRSSALRSASCTCCSRDCRGPSPAAALPGDAAPLLGEALRLRLSLFSFCSARLLKGGTVCCLNGSETGALACTVIRQHLEASLAQWTRRRPLCDESDSCFSAHCFTPMVKRRIHHKRPCLLESCFYAKMVYLWRCTLWSGGRPGLIYLGRAAL